ncbi:MAG: isoleucine--tRNA ligase [Candidatus Asgardarchaeia archaeon]
MFKKVKPRVFYPEIEREVIKFWKEKGCFRKQLELRKGSKKFVFLEGPPTANGMPHPGHVFTRTMKDIVCRYKSMKGFYVPRKAGWDCHGLPVEIEVEKELGLKNKKDIENYGVERFNEMCKKSVFRYEDAWVEMTERLGFWIDMDNPYITLENDYIESVWWSLKKLWERGLIYRGYKVVWYCPRCGTPLSSHEVALGYKKVKDPSVFVKFPLVDRKNTFLLAWTTTPWTLPSNVALAVNPDFEYALVKSDGEYFILAKDLVEKVLDEYELVEVFGGKELEGWKYKPLFDYADVDDNAYYVILADFVTLEEGTGIVHIAPAYGEEDYEVSKEYNLPVVQLVNQDGKFVEEAEKWAGMFFKEADPYIIKDLEERGLLYKHGEYEHDYPFCWRCETPLLNYARNTWYIKMSDLRDELLRNNDMINWVPDYIKHGRFGNFLENVVDWALSRERYWGTPFPMWVCEKCEYKMMIGSREELKKYAINKPRKEDLHKPYIDEVILRCPKCGGNMKRVPDLIDVWYDSGAAPFAQYHYPFENKELFEESFPADFICEAVDQTRGWFYSLLAISTALFNKPAYKNVLVLGLILDEKGQKMSKSKGNVIDPWEVFNKFGADSFRWYLTSTAAPWDPIKFRMSSVEEVSRRFLDTLWNVYTFFVTYARIDNYDPREEHLPYEEREEIDRWIISRLNSVTKEVTEYMDNFLLHKAARVLESFVIDELSNWYVRRSRRRFWTEEMNKSKKSAYDTLYEVLFDTIKLLAPFVPFITEHIYQNLVVSVYEDAAESVHYLDYPVANEDLIDKGLEEAMDHVLRIVESGRLARFKAKIKARQPLREVLVKCPKEIVNELSRFEDVIKEELNVKRVTFVENLSDRVKVNLKLNYRSLGPKYKALLPKISKKLEEVDVKEVEKTFSKVGKITLEVGGEEVIINKEDVILEKEAVDEGWVYSSKGDIEVVLDARISEDLFYEGIARDIVRRIQQMRKEMDLDYTDRIKIYYAGTAPVEEAFKRHLDYIMSETLCDEVNKGIRKEGYLKRWKIGEEVLDLEIIRSNPH